MARLLDDETMIRVSDEIKNEVADLIEKRIAEAGGDGDADRCAIALFAFSTTLERVAAGNVDKLLTLLEVAVKNLGSFGVRAVMRSTEQDDGQDAPEVEVEEGSEGDPGEAGRFDVV